MAMLCNGKAWDVPHTFEPLACLGLNVRKGVRQCMFMMSGVSFIKHLISKRLWSRVESIIDKNQCHVRLDKSKFNGVSA